MKQNAYREEKKPDLVVGNLDDFISELQAIRKERGGDMPVVTMGLMSDGSTGDYSAYAWFEPQDGKVHISR